MINSKFKVLLFRLYCYYSILFCFLQATLTRRDSGPDCSYLDGLQLDVVHILGVTSGPSDVITTPESATMEIKYEADHKVGGETGRGSSCFGDCTAVDG